MGRFSDYNIISIGDHCSIPIILKELNVRKKSYPFDWVTKIDHIHDTNIIYNIQLINQLHYSENVDYIVQMYIGNALENEDKVNVYNNIWFPHETENITDIFEKYKRRFLRLKDDLYEKNIFILLTRHYYIEKDIFEMVIIPLLNYNSDSIILFISGTNHTYFEIMNYRNVIFKYIEYDISKFFQYDYDTFRPNIRNFLSDWML
jgi:hypothetical protein